LIGGERGDSQRKNLMELAAVKGQKREKIHEGGGGTGNLHLRKGKGGRKVSILIFFWC